MLNKNSPAFYLMVCTTAIGATANLTFCRMQCRTGSQNTTERKGSPSLNIKKNKNTMFVFVFMFCACVRDASTSGQWQMHATQQHQPHMSWRSGKKSEKCGQIDDGWHIGTDERPFPFARIHAFARCCVLLIRVDVPRVFAPHIHTYNVQNMSCRWPNRNW